MLNSMTGYGHGEAESNQKKITIDIKAVNGKFLDQTIKISKSLMPLEDFIRKEIAAKLSRGTVDVYVSFYDYADNSEDVIINSALASKILDGAKNLSADVMLDNNLTIRDLLRFPDVITYDKLDLNIEEIKPLVKEAVDNALTQLCNMRQVEGKNLYFDLKEKIDNIESNMKKIESIAPTVEKDYYEKLKFRIHELLNGVEVDETKLLNEVAFFADKADINEEIVRMKSHIKQFNEILNSDEPAGKKFEFLSQEMTRETNTLGSKANNLELTNLVLYQKNELEKIKEQIRNVE